MARAAEPSDLLVRRAGRVAQVSRGWRLSYLAIALLVIGQVLWGFWPSYYGRLGREAVVRPLVIHAHGAVFAGWLALLVLQISLVVTGHVRWHRRVGRLGIAYGLLVLSMGLVVSFAAPVLHMRAGEMTLDAAAESLIWTLVDMLLFAGFFGSAVAWRQSRDVHKRLMLAATVTLAFAGVGRMNLWWPLFLLLWLSPMAAAMAVDMKTTGRVHPVLSWSTAIFAIAFTRIFVAQSEGWLRIGRKIIAPFL